MEKAKLRATYKKLRENLSVDFIEENSLQIANMVLKLPIWDKTYYHLFLSITGKKEVETQYILHILQGKDKSVVLSKADFENNTLSHILLQENTLIKTSTHGIPEPVTGIEIPLQNLEVVFVPLLAYDLRGHRLGYGKGFYDRFLVECRPGTILVGLSFFDPEKEIFFEETDVPLHFCVTPKNIYSF